MSGADKYWEGEELRKKGWTEDPEKENWWIPPPNLYASAPKSFYVYDGRDLQAILDPNNYKEV